MHKKQRMCKNEILTLAHVPNIAMKLKSFLN